ncbi:MAG: ABC transporter ATP-binding protein [Burkholderiales bacterium]
MINLTDIRHRYGERVVLDMPSFAIAAGEECLLLGASGSGKTTLLHILAGILKPSEGDVTIDGTRLSSLSGTALDRFRGQHIGIVLQKLHLIGSISALQNLLLAQTLSGRAADETAALRLLDGLGLAAFSTAKPKQLSHGQAQRLAIARAVINQPKLIIADEPTSNLDDKHAGEALQLLRSQAHACGAALVVATHDARVKQHIPRRLELAST